MKYSEIKVSSDNTHFTYKDKKLFNKSFIEVLKFHKEGFAPVCDKTGWYHINLDSIPIYKQRYERVFGYYYRRSSVIENGKWFHIDETGNRIYNTNYNWTGNYQENACAVRDSNEQYFHIDLKGEPLYNSKYNFVGDYKDGYACVRLPSGYYKHIDSKGEFLNDIEFLDLGIFHKNYAIAKDTQGWFHIDKKGMQLYKERYLMIEPFYNGFSVVDTLNKRKQIIDENGQIILVM